VIRTVLAVLVLVLFGAGAYFAGAHFSLMMEPVLSGEEIQKKVDAEDFEGAIRSVRRLLLDHPGDGALLETLGNLHEQNDEPKKAEAIYRGLLEKNGNDAMLNFDLARALYRENRISESLAQMAMARSLAKRRAGGDSAGIVIMTHALAGEIYMQNTREYRKAIPEYAQLLKLDPKRADIRYQLGMAYAYAGQYQSAFGEFDRIVKENPGTEIAKYAQNAIQYVRERRNPGKSNVLLNYGE